MASDRRTRPGSRLLLGIALFAGTLASICGGALLADFALDPVELVAVFDRNAGR